MITLIYAAYGEPIPDHNVDAIVEELIETHNLLRGERFFYTSTAEVFTAMRLAVLEGKIAFDDIVFDIEGKETLLNEYAVPIQSEVCDPLWRCTDRAERIMILSVKKRKNKEMT